MDPTKGQLWEDTAETPKEWVEVLHVSDTHVIVQRRYGPGRYEREQFGTRFRYITDAGVEPADAVQEELHG